MPMRKEEVVEQLRYKFTQEEMDQNIATLVEKMESRDQMVANHKATKAALKERETAIDVEVSTYQRLCRDRFEMRAVKCAWRYNMPEPGKKTLIRLDTNEDVRTDIMLDHERQELLQLETPSHVLAGPGSLKDKKVNEIAIEDIDYVVSRDNEDLLKYGWLQGDIDAVREEKTRRDSKPTAVPSPVVTPIPPEEEAQAAAALAAMSAGCSLCDSGAPLDESGRFHPGASGDPADDVECPVAARNAALLKPEEAEAPATLPSLREMGEGTHAAEGKRTRRSRTQTDADAPSETPADQQETAPEV